MKLSFRYVLRLISAFLIRFRVIIIIGIIIGILFFTIAKIVLPIFLSNTTQKIAITGRYSPNTLPRNILSKISTGLTNINDNYEIEPAIATKWETTDNGKTWVFELKENVFWQDGKKLISKDIKYDFSGVKVDYPNDRTISFELESNYSPFPGVVTEPIFKSGLLGLGEWTVSKMTVSGGFLQRLEIKNNNKKIIYKFYPSEERSKLAFKLGQVDFIENLYDKKPFDTWENIKIDEKINNNLVTTIFFNVEDNFLSEKNLRQALYYAIDKNSFGFERAISPIPINSWVYNPQVKPYDYAKQRAIDIVKELPDEFKSNLNIKLVTTPTLLSIGEKIVKDWNDIGVKSEILVVSTIPSEYQAFLAIFEAPADPDQYSIWHSTQIQTNISKYKNPRIDKLLEDGRTELNSDNRRKIYLDFQRYLLEDVPAAFLFYQPTYHIGRI